MKNNWTIDTIENRYYKILKLLEKEKNPEKLELLQLDLEYLKEIIESSIINDTNNVKLLELYNNIKELYLNYKFIWSDIIEFKDFTQKPLGNIPDLKNHSLSKREILELTHDFYKNYTDRYFFGNFMKHYYRRNDHVKFSNYINKYAKGFSINISSLHESFINTTRNYTLEDILNLIHEYSHAISSTINPYHLSQNKSLFSEIDSIFMELIATDFLEKSFKNNQGIILKNRLHEEYAIQAIASSLQIQIIELEQRFLNNFTTNKSFKNNIQNYLYLDGEFIDNLIYETAPNNIEYIESYIFALELYQLYQEDPEKALSNLKKILLMKYISNEEYYHNIKNLGLIPNLSVILYHKERCNEVLKLTQSKK